MADFQTNQPQQKGNFKRKTHNTRVDLTPMVDLGFLLITFFIFSTSLSKPSVMKMNLPKDEGVENLTPIAQSKVLTILPTANNKILYYFGNDVQHMQTTNFGNLGIRNIIQQKQQQVKQQFGNTKETIVLIKPTEQSTYQNLVNILDEMLINDVTRYMLLDVTSTEKAMVKN